MMSSNFHVTRFPNAPPSGSCAVLNSRKAALPAVQHTSFAQSLGFRVANVCEGLCLSGSSQFFRVNDPGRETGALGGFNLGARHFWEGIWVLGVLLWMDKILHDFETMRKHCLLVLIVEPSLQGFLGAGFRPSPVGSLSVHFPLRVDNACLAAASQ